MEVVNFNIEYAHVYGEMLNRGGISNEEHAKNISIAKEIAKGLRKQGKTYSLSILLDDYNEEAIEVSDDEIFLELKRMGLPPDHIMRESHLATSMGEALINAIDSRYLEKDKVDEVVFIPKSNDVRLWSPEIDVRSLRRIFWEKSESARGKKHPERKDAGGRAEAIVRRKSFHSESKIILKYKDEKNISRYTCPLLTACWHLVRLGVKPFAEEFTNIRSYTDKPFFGKRLITVLPSSYLKIEGTALEIISLAKSKTIKKRKNDLEYHLF